MYLKIDGTDILPYLEEKGFKWSRNDLEASDSGRTMDGIMHRGRVATKIRLDLTFLPMDENRIQTVMRLLYPEFVTVDYIDPLFGARSVRMYSNNISSTIKTAFDVGTGLWDGFTAPLIER